MILEPSMTDETEILKTLTKTVMNAVEALVDRRLASRSMPVVDPIQDALPPLEQTSDVRRIHLYVAACRGAAEIGRRYGHPAYKIGTTTQHLETRLREIGKDEFGAAVRRNGKLILEPGFKGWVSQIIHATRDARVAGVSVLTRSIMVDLPPDMTTRVFDKAVHDALASRALRPGTELGREQRLTIYSLGSKDRVSVANEFYLIDPRTDGDMLLEAVEGILVRHARRTRHPITTQ